MEADWIDVGAAAELARREVQVVALGKKRVALTCRNGEFGAIDNACNHLGGPLGEGRLAGDYVVCPWHYWKFHRTSGSGEPGYEADAVPSHAVRVEAGRVLVSREARSKRSRRPHEPHPLARPVERAAGPMRMLGISTTAMTAGEERYSTSEALLEHALEHARAELASETQLLRLRDLAFRECEGFYSKSARACTWPCSITAMDKNDQMERVYEAIVHWADVVLIATPIRWGAASSLYFKMAERMNCIQNQETIAKQHLIVNKVAGFVITGGQDNVQGVAGQLLGFFSELGFHLPPFPYIAHSRGWSSEDMENNVRIVRESESLREAARALAARCAEMSRVLLSGAMAPGPQSRGGRKAHAPERREHGKDAE
jgi:nitrite reductase/ring-hydroxylating ferredoxin subunit/multimeric flavodoxin WrbA